MELDARERQLIVEAVTGLPDAEKLVMTAIYWEGASPEQLAQLLELRNDLWRVAGLPGKTPQQGKSWPAKGPGLGRRRTVAGRGRARSAAR